MEAIHVHKVVEKDGEILLTGLPYKKGQYVEMRHYLFIELKLQGS